MTTLQALVIGATQGLTELAPISSLGHGVVLPALLGWGELERDPSYLPFMVSLHLGTTAALLLYFYREWVLLLRSVMVLPGSRQSPELLTARRVLFLLVAGTIPAGILGLLLEKRIRHLFSAPALAGIFLIVNGVLLILAEWMRRKGKGQGGQRGMVLESLGLGRAFSIGIFQAVALLPGISRSGITMVGGLWSGLDHEDAARFSFLLSTPIIGAAGVLEVPKLLRHGSPGALHLALVGGGMAFAMAWLTTFLLMRYFRNYESTRALVPFGVYCLLAGSLSLYLLR